MAKSATRTPNHAFIHHEALDRTWCLLMSMDTNLGWHTFIQKDPEAKRLYQAAHQALFDLYQHLGKLMPDDEAAS